jgi:hypothetical protein
MNVQTRRKQTDVPDLLSVGTLHHNVLEIILRLQADEACTYAILKAMPKPSVGCPEPFLSSQPTEDLAFERCQGSPDWLVRTEHLRSLIEV